jgi:hypothetical protein
MDTRSQTQGCPWSSHGIPMMKSPDLPRPHGPRLVWARAVTDFNAPSSKMAVAQMQREEVCRHLHKFGAWQCQCEDDAKDAALSSGWQRRRTVRPSS